MTYTITATYEGGVLKPPAPLPLAEGQAVQVAITVPSSAVGAGDEASRRAAAVKALQDAFDAANEGDDLPDGYDFFAAMNANRAPGERVLYPPELKGVTW